MNLVYLASPYKYRGPEYIDSDLMIGNTPFTMGVKANSQEIEEERYQQAIDACAWLMNKGYSVISPIVATHPIAVKHKLPLGSEYWMQFDEILLNKCDEMMILMIQGVLESPGVSREFQINMKNGKDTKLLVPNSEKPGEYYINDMDWETRDCLEM